MTQKKDKRTALKIAQDDELLIELRLKNFSLRHIAKVLKISAEQVRRDEKRILKKMQSQTSDSADLLLIKDLKRLEMVENAAWVGWANSLRIQSKKSVKSFQVELTGTPYRQDAEGNIEEFKDMRLRVPAEEVTTTTTKTNRDGSPAWLNIIISCIQERNKLLGTYDRVEEDDDDTPIDGVVFQQALYIPGLGEITPDILQQLQDGANKRDLYHLLEGLLTNQDPHNYQQEATADVSTSEAG